MGAFGTSLVRGIWGKMLEVLVVDDNPDDGEFLRDLLSGIDDFSVRAVHSGQEALIRLDECRVDCVLLDNRLDGEDGLAILAALRSKELFLPVVMITGFDGENLAPSALRAGAKSCLLKSTVRAENLEAAIRDAIRDCQTDRANALGTDYIAKRILLVEDNADDREHIAEMIRRGNARAAVEVAATGAEALSYFKANGHDCVILDYRLEAEDGLDILAAFKAISPFTPVVMLTGQGNEEVAAKSIKVGAAEYLIKQRLNETYLRSAIDNAISRSSLEARVADQDAERRQFLNILVHDLRQPIRHVRALGELAKEELATGETAQLLETLASQAIVATQADELIQTLGGYAMLDQDVAFFDVDLVEAAEAAKQTLSIDIAERQALVTIQDMPTVHGNKAQLIQLFQNLIGNGLKYNHANPPKITIDVEAQDAQAVTVAVADNGIGIPEEYLHSIFAPLKRLWAKHDYEGTGLGLATCQKIVSKHRGVIWCTSTEGEGSKFHIRLPLPPKGDAAEMALPPVGHS